MGLKTEDDLEGRDSAGFWDYLTVMRQKTTLIKLIKVAADQQPVSKKRSRHVAFDRQSASFYRKKNEELWAEECLFILPPSSGQTTPEEVSHSDKIECTSVTSPSLRRQFSRRGHPSSVGFCEIITLLWRSCLCFMPDMEPLTTSGQK